MTERADTQAADEEEEAAEADPRRGADPSDETDAEPDDGTGHLDDIEDGAGCTEIWERLSERREG
ncbi:hypothetical protein CK500_07115 [Halorubrum salipaludis]|uniref:Uncharacterized protein n=1 Tax=Halorubrum salipaludis TaxID=2032630 RepID=A0A2A2FFI4_9EURY|nr:MULTISPECIES: hypothetical protein [Halorubrum]PAU84196.1 hypothetical protein CK500_07115 [Halorubrum salipaludis]